MRIDIFVLNYDGEDYILECVGSLQKAIERSIHDCALTVIDNCSTDQSIALLRTHFSEVRIQSMRENKVLCSFNEVVSNSQADLVFLLNNDLRADPGFIDPMVETFSQKKDAFLVSAKSCLFDHSYDGGRAIPLMKKGLLSVTCHYKGYEHTIDEPGITFAAGYGAFDRQKFLTLGGFDELYLPGRLEDIDIALRAWRRGWKCYYQPKSLLYHYGGKSFVKRFGHRGTMEIAHRNTFLLMWKHMTHYSDWFSHLFFLLPRMIWMTLRGQGEFVTGFFKALSRWNLVLSRRRSEKRIPYLHSDRDIISLFLHHGN